MNYFSYLAVSLTALHATATLPTMGQGIEEEQFEQFTAALHDMQESQSGDYYAAVKIVLEATGDEMSIDAWMEQAALNNVPAALLYVANTRISGILFNQDDDKTITNHLHLLKKAADANYIPAILYYSTCLNAGLRRKPDRAQALRILTPIASTGDKEARFKWLQLSGRLQGLSDLKRPEVAAEIDKGNDCVMMYISMLTVDKETRIAYMQDAADLGNSQAYYELGVHVERINPKLSYEMMQKAAKLHHPNALAVIGSLESTPSTTDDNLSKTDAEFNPEEGLSKIKLAAMIGSSIAQGLLGEQYLHGSDLIDQDLERAFYHIQHAACQSDASATLLYSYMLLEGLGCEATPEKGLSICVELINRKVKSAILLYAYATYKGLGVQSNIQDSIDILQEAASYEIPEAYVYLAFITQKGGEQLKADAKQAELYLRMAKIDLGDKAEQLYQKLQKAGEWVFTP